MRNIVILALTIFEVSGIQIKTPERIAGQGYPVESHTVFTSDGYILTMYRIPYSPRLNNKNVTDKPVVFFVHGLFCSSDTWLLCGPDNGLAYMLVDAGYDVWLANCRGNLYSRNHTILNPYSDEYWNFSWHEIGIYDLPAMMNYILNKTEQDGVHYIGHSQGHTVLMVLLSEIPSYNVKIKTSYHMSPVAFSNHAQSPFYKVLAPFWGQPSLLATYVGKSEFVPNNWFLNKLGSEICQEQSPFLIMCANIMFLIGGWNSSHFNYTLLSDVVATHPAGCSTRQYFHFLQGYISGHFRQYDYDFISNQLIYGSPKPPDYKLGNINLTSPMHLIYSSNDYLSDVTDVEHLADILKENVILSHVCYLDYNHFDFIWGIDVKEVVNDCIVDLINLFEGRQFNGTFCKCMLGLI